jgi:hypothetical protein
MTDKEYFLHDFLPYHLSQKKNGDISTGLKEYQALLNISLETIENLKNANWHQFDSLVGENACQIRTFFVASYAEKSIKNIKILEEQLIKAKEKINTLIFSRALTVLMNSELSLCDVIHKESLKVQPDPIELFLIESFILAKAKVEFPSKTSLDSLFKRDAADPKRLKEFGDISSTFSHNLVRKGLCPYNCVNSERAL